MKNWILIVLFFVTAELKAQLFADKVFYPGLSAVKTKTHNGSGGKGYWSLKRLDSLGRPIVEENYQKGSLLSKTVYTYNSQDDRILEVLVFDINSPERIDSTFTAYEYNQTKHIIRQNRHYANKDSTVFELVRNTGDSILDFKKTSFFFRPATKQVEEIVFNYELAYNSRGNLVRLKKDDLQNNTSETTHYEYYKDGYLKRRRIGRHPEPEFEIVYTGGPGGDDMHFKYTYDKKGRVKKMYSIVDEKVYKVASYQYKKK